MAGILGIYGLIVAPTRASFPSWFPYLSATIGYMRTLCTQLLLCVILILILKNDREIFSTGPYHVGAAHCRRMLRRYTPRGAGDRVPKGTGGVRVASVIISSGLRAEEYTNMGGYVHLGAGLAAGLAALAAGMAIGVAHGPPSVFSLGRTAPYRGRRARHTPDTRLAFLPVGFLAGGSVPPGEAPVALAGSPGQRDRRPRRGEVRPRRHGGGRGVRGSEVGGGRGKAVFFSHGTLGGGVCEWDGAAPRMPRGRPWT